MLDELVCPQGLVAEAIDRAQADADALRPVLAAGDDARRAAAAIIAGRLGHAALIEDLIALLDDDGLAARAATWALGVLPAQSALLTLAADGSIDQRENAYRALAQIAARGAAEAGLEADLRQRLDEELARASGGGTGLGEYVCGVLAILGVDDFDALAQGCIDGDPYGDRFELQRQRKAVANDGQDRERIAELTAPWYERLADACADVAGEAEAPTGDPLVIASGDTTPSRESDADRAPPTGGAPESPNATGPDTPQASGAAPSDDADAPPPGDAPPAIDWQAFAASPAAQSLDPQIAQLAVQLGPLYEQLAIQAVRAPLTDLSGQELMALALQVLPQALPPQHAQMALSPQAINALQAVVQWLKESGQASDGEDLLAGVKQLRHMLREQVRSSGMLGGPDYSDPDEAPPAPAD